METKLTIRLKKRVIDRAKNYAENHKTSVSKMIESYLEIVTREKDERSEITPLVESLSGVIHLIENVDYKHEYSDYLSEKYK